MRIAFSAAVFAAGCARGATRALAPAPAAIDTVWYVSSRARVDGRDTRQHADSLEYGFAIFARKPSDDLRAGALSVSLVDSARLTAGEFVAKLRARTLAVASPHDYAVLYVHGYATSLHEAWMYANVAHARTGSAAPWIAFCWPSNGSGFAAPRRQQLFARAYREDSAAASVSHSAFAQATRVVLEAVGASRLVLAPHSLGAQVVGETLAGDTDLRGVLGQTPLRAVAFIAPDIEWRRFAEYIVPAVQPLTRRLLLYTSTRDRVLALSRSMNASRRAGLHNGAPLVRVGIETVDVTMGVSVGGWLQQTFGTHHAIRRASATLFDLAWVVGPERVADCRLTIGTGVRGEDDVWRLTPLLPNSDIVVERCSPMERR